MLAIFYAKKYKKEFVNVRRIYIKVLIWQKSCNIGVKIVDLKGKVVMHTIFGEGEISKIDGDYIIVSFYGEGKRFKYPEAFETFLTIKEKNIESEINDLINKKKVEEQKEIEKRKESYIKITKPKKRVKKVKELPKANIAFKCNYCDGGKSSNRVGYYGACSDKMIKHNIGVEHKVWCSCDESPCKKYYDGVITRRELDNQCKEDGFVCYESQMLKYWKAYAGVYHLGENKGKPMKLKQVRANSLCILTTREPNMNEEDRYIFAVFLVDETYEGDNTEEGYVTTSSKYKIELSPKEARRMKFWMYHANTNNPKRTAWNTGLHRYFQDLEGAQILRDLAYIKRGTKDEGLAKDFLNHFCIVNGVVLETVSKPNGAICK